MEKYHYDLISECFQDLIDELNLQLEPFHTGNYRVFMKGDPFGIEIEKYHRDFTCILFRKKEYYSVGLYNLLEYLRVDPSEILETTVFLGQLDEEELLVYWKKQFGKMTFTIHKNLPTIRDWFSHEHFEKRHEELKEHFK